MTPLLRFLGALLGAGLAASTLLFGSIPGQAQQVLPPLVGPNGIACAYNTVLPTLTNLNAGWVQCDSSGRLLTSSSGSSSSVSITAGPVNITPTDCSGTITTGGTAQNAITASTTIHGFSLANVDASTGSGEPLGISLTGTAAIGSTGTYPLSPPSATTFAGLSSYTTPFGFGTNHAVSVIAATTGHQFSCTYW